LMLTVIGGLYAYNTFADSAQPVHAQTDRAANWTVTPVVVGGNQEHIVIVTETDNPYEDGKTTKQMAVYELRSNGSGKAQLYFVAARTLAYDFKFPDINDTSTNNDKYSPAKLKKAAEDEAKRRKND
ncbi:MAG: hypothetical protein IT463_14355, partial [Planctomycetes bacterium]|nr:hypothetical protein [Planctomycetota bacterium]